MNKIDFIKLVLDFLTTIAIFFTGIQIIINRKQLYLSTITKCISDFRNLGELNLDTTDSVTLRKYIDLTNEELFYFQHRYLPKVVSKEWIEGMIDFIPITNNKGIILNEAFAIKYLTKNRIIILQNFPRIQNAFEIKEIYNFELIYSKEESKRIERIKERKKLILEILKNIKKFDGFN